MTVSGDHVRIKICGLTRADEAVACLCAGADWIGLNFHAHSPRSVTLDRGAEIMAALPSPARAVGLFVDRPAIEVSDVAAELGLSAVQLHGNEPLEYLQALNHLWIIKAFRLGRESDIRTMSDYLARAGELGRMPDAVLIDAQVAGMVGGTGTLVADALLPLLPAFSRMILAGGLRPENVAERLQRVHPWMVDVASGVESSPGRKDLAKVRAFIHAARSARDA
jgi:phosphoribosylanthranilate isomerase